VGRIIKFRAWSPTDERNPEMLSWEMLKEADNDDLCWGLCDVFEGYLGMVPMQYTGLIDKNGVEIYEGDIVKTICGTIAHVNWCVKYSMFEYVTLGDFDCNGQSMVCSQDALKVIGNIHENPELYDDATNNK